MNHRFKNLPFALLVKSFEPFVVKKPMNMKTKRLLLILIPFFFLTWSGGTRDNSSLNFEEEKVILTPKPGPAPRINGAKIFGVRPGSPFLYTITGRSLVK
jgi:hypothetical protein